MAQFAVHIATGIISGRAVNSKYLSYGLFAGAILPDFDFIPMLLIYPFNADIARMFHRSATHTLIIPVILCLFALFLYASGKSRITPALLCGIAAGFMGHILFDILFWFDRVNLLWPLHFNGVPFIADIWAGLHLPAAVKSLLGPASEFLYYGIFFHWIRRFSVDQTGFIAGKLRLFELLSFAFFTVSIIPAFYLGEKRFAELVYGVTSFFFAPLSLMVLWKVRDRLFTDTINEAAAEV